MYNYIIMSATLQAIILIGAAASAIGAIAFFFTKIFKLFGTWFTFIQDWYGTDDKPGVNERLNHGAERFEYIEGELRIIKEELFNNHGSSLRDAIDRIEAAVAKPKRSSSPKN
jgi:hypothetical protein